MKLVPASSPGIEAAHRNTYVRTIVDILLRDRSLLRLTAMFLKKYSSSDQEGFERGLEAIRLTLSRPDVNGVVAIADHINKLAQNLLNLYRQKDAEKIKYQRGAIVEQLACKLIYRRYSESGEACLNNQRFVENYEDITVQEVDVAALSNPRRKAEGYECKMNPAAFKDYDGTNLSNLVEAAEERQYRINVGFISFESDAVMKLKLAKFRLADFIHLYGLDSMEKLEHLSFLEN